MLVAAARGVVDFSSYRAGNSADRLRLLFRLRTLRQELINQRRLAFAQYYLAAMQVDGISGDDYKSLRDLAIDNINAYTDGLMPWASKAQANAEASTIKTLSNAWEQEFGRLDDPETQRGIEETVAALRRERLANKEKRQRMQAAREQLLQRDDARRQRKKQPAKRRR